MKWPIILLCVLLIGIGIGYWLGTQQPKPQHIAQVFTSVGDLMLTPNPGDVLEWKNATVKFKNPEQTPCTETNPGKQCTIKPGLDAGVYFYDCDSPGCIDPAVAMGTDTIKNLSKGGTAGILPPPYADPKGPKVQCDTTTKKATADDLKAARGDSFHYYPNGNVAFTITFAAGTCSQGDVLTNAAADCTLTQTATIPQPAYKIQIGGGSCQDGTGKLNSR